MRNMNIVKDLPISKSGYRYRYPQMSQDELIERQELEIDSLVSCNKLLKEHLDFLRNKIEEKNKQIEMYSEVIVAMDEKLKGDSRELHLLQINLN